MFVAPLILIIVLGLMSCAMTTPEQRAESRRKFARWNPLFISIILGCLAIMLYPWKS
jgi:hypothetical protein